MRCTSSRLVVSCLSFLIFLIVTAPTVAIPPDLLREYQFVPRHSTLGVQGGFAGFDLRLPIFGEFDFVTGFRFSFPLLEPYASFANVEAQATYLPDFGPYYAFDIDESLNLSGLDGSPLPVGAPVELYRFEGEDGQGAPMEVLVATLGRWLYMKGANDPPCCDFFDYQIRALARQTPHPDFDINGTVDHNDLTMWEAGYAGSVTEGMSFLDWQRELGEAPPVEYLEAVIDTALSAGFEAARVPEPTSLYLISIWIFVAFGIWPGARSCLSGSVGSCCQ